MHISHNTAAKDAIHDPSQLPHHVRDLIQPLWRRHRSLDRQTPHVLPPLLQQADQVIDSQHNIGDQLVLGHAHIPHSDTQAQDLLQLKLNG